MNNRREFISFDVRTTITRNKKQQEKKRNIA